MMNEYDTIIIGGGPGGLAAAYPLAEEQRVLIIERNLWGGTCPNFGCDPKKMLYSAVEAKDWSARMTGSGLNGIPDVNWPRLMAFKRSYTETVPAGTKGGLNQAGITTIDGQAQLLDGKTVQVDDEIFTATNIIIATGQKPVMPDIPGAENLGTSTDFLDLDQLPRTLAFIGAGYVALELANIAASAGAEVHIVNHSDRILRAFPENATKQLRQLMQQKRIIFHDNVEVEAVHPTAEGVRLTGDGLDLRVHRAFSAMGRKPAIDGLGLEAIGMDLTKKGIVVDDHLQTSIPGVFAIGDVIAKDQPKLTPVSSFEGRYVAIHLLGSTDPIVYPKIPSIVYGSAMVGQVGIPLATAQANPDQYTVSSQNTTHWYTYNRIKDPLAQVTTIVDKQSDQLVGAVVVSTIADELINYFTMIINQHLTRDDLQRQILAYPSPASDLGYFY